MNCKTKTWHNSNIRNISKETTQTSEELRKSETCLSGKVDIELKKTSNRKNNFLTLVMPLVLETMCNGSGLVTAGLRSPPTILIKHFPSSLSVSDVQVPASGTDPVSGTGRLKLFFGSSLSFFWLSLDYSLTAICNCWLHLMQKVIMVFFKIINFPFYCHQELCQ